MTSQTYDMTAGMTAGAAIAHLLGKVEERMRGLLASERTRWSAVGSGTAAAPVDDVAQLLAAGGKRLRPAFCLIGYLAADGRLDNETIVDPAAALEFLHAFALIHDDVLDNSPLRRGSPTVHARRAADHAARGWSGESRRYGEGAAILAGDLAYVYADRLVTDIPPRAREIWGQLRTEMIIGQFLDINAAAALDGDPATARWIALCKSGRYTIQRPLELGAAIAGRADLTPAFARYGAALGEAFQLRDDLIDAFGDSRNSGKPAGLDLAQHKMTLLMTLAMEADERVGELIRQQGTGAMKPEALRQSLIGLGAREEVERRIEVLVDEARAAIAGAAMDQCWSDELAEMAYQVAYRDR